MSLEERQRWAERFLDESADPPAPLTFEGLARAGPGTGFSPFLPDDADRAREASRQLMLAADEAGGGDVGLEAAERRAEELRSAEDASLVRFAFKLFLTHHPDGRRLRIPALERRAPLKVVPSGLALAPPAPGAEATRAGETVLNWWREDPEANEHHDHWHAVYPTRGIADPRPGDPKRTRLQDRQGELFFYMHQQMLARYDHERLAVRLPRVEALARYGEPVEEGYDPSEGLRGFPPELWTEGGAPRVRPAGTRLPDDLPGWGTNGGTLRRAELATWHERLLDAVFSGRLRGVGEMEFSADLDDLGHATEPSRARGRTARPEVPDPDHYGRLHGAGHGFLGMAAGEPAGVMIDTDTDTAIRDPARWSAALSCKGLRQARRSCRRRGGRPRVAIDRRARRPCPAPGPG